MVLVVTFESPTEVTRFIAHEAIPFPVLSDVPRRAYAAFGLQRGRASKIWGWSTAKVYLRDLLGGHLPRLPHGDLSQLGGDVVLDAGGRVLFLYRSENPTDRPSIETILAVIRSVRDDR